jgi:hypothetical protein
LGCFWFTAIAVTQPVADLYRESQAECILIGEVLPIAAVDRFRDAHPIDRQF